MPRTGIFSRRRNRLACSAGHTVVETLVALAVLSAVLVPAAQIAARIMTSHGMRDTIIAASLARETMERAIAEPKIHAETKAERLNGKQWRIDYRTREQSGLRLLSVSVFRARESEPVAVLQTLRFMQE